MVKTRKNLPCLGCKNPNSATYTLGEIEINSTFYIMKIECSNCNTVFRFHPNLTVYMNPKLGVKIT